MVQTSTPLKQALPKSWRVWPNLAVSCLTKLLTNFAVEQICQSLITSACMAFGAGFPTKTAPSSWTSFAASSRWVACFISATTHNRAGPPWCPCAIYSPNMPKCWALMEQVLSAASTALWDLWTNCWRPTPLMPEPIHKWPNASSRSKGKTATTWLTNTLTATGSPWPLPRWRGGCSLPN